MGWGKDKKQKPVKNPRIPFATCGKVVKTQKMPNGSTVQVLCQFNKNVPHGH